MIFSFINIWKNYTFEIILGISIIFIIIFAIYCKIKGIKGTYNNEKNYKYFINRKKLLKTYNNKKI